MYTGVSVGSQEVIAIAQNATTYSAILRTDKSAGFTGMLLTVSAGSITVTQQCGLKDSGLFYDPVDADNLALGQVASLVGAETRWIAPLPILSPFTRFKIVEANVASATVTFTPLFQEDR